MTTYTADNQADAFRDILRVVKQGHTGNFFEKPLYSSCPQLYGEMFASLTDPNRGAPDEKWVAISHYANALQAAILVAHHAMHNCQEAGGKTVDEQIEQLNQFVESHVKASESGQGAGS
ncbi:MAG: hypothetical protein CK431_09955 [Mycobacterium sp.]|nr:MAG: hypothetical protein CK431_09955 [Mycobacterium sp.]